MSKIKEWSRFIRRTNYALFYYLEVLMIRANCHEHFTKYDLEFLLSALTKYKGQRPALERLMADPEVLDQLLDNRSLIHEVLDRFSLAQISPYLFFYVLIRRVLLDFGINDRPVSSYLSCLLTEFGYKERMFKLSIGDDKKYYYLVDLIDALNQRESDMALLIQSHIGNYSLFIAGIFPEYIYQRYTYGNSTVSLNYYEDMGSTYYYRASEHRLARVYSLDSIYMNLASRFKEFRRALNSLADRYLMIKNRESIEDTIKDLLYSSEK